MVLIQFLVPIYGNDFSSWMYSCWSQADSQINMNRSPLCTHSLFFLCHKKRTVIRLGLYSAHRTWVLQDSLQENKIRRGKYAALNKQKHTHTHTKSILPYPSLMEPLLVQNQTGHKYYWIEFVAVDNWMLTVQQKRSGWDILREGPMRPSCAHDCLIVRMPLCENTVLRESSMYQPKTRGIQN